MAAKCRCPRCGTDYPANNTHGHCSRCHETFVGLAAFEKHWITRNDERVCIGAELIDGNKKWWQDDKGFWHHGEKLTAEQREELWGNGQDG